MNPCNFSRFLAGGICAITLVITVPVQAQDEDIGTLVNNAIASMKKENWKEGLAYNQKAIDRFGQGNPLMLYGPQFGTIYYRKGLCEMKLKKWEDAIKSFKTCYEDFPNKEKLGNQFEKMALLKWGEAAMGMEDWEGAITQFQKFLKERDKNRDKFSQGVFHVSLAICHYKLGRIPEGNENLEIAIKNKEKFATPDSAIVAGFQALVSGVILTQNEQALLDFIEKNRGEIIIDPYAMYAYSRVFMKLAGTAVGAKMERAAMALYQLVPSADAALDDTRARLKSIGASPQVNDGRNILDRKSLEDELKAIEAEKRGKKSIATVKLAATAFLHEKYGNIRGAYSAYKQLETYYPTSDKREDYLFSLIRTSLVVASVPETQGYAKTFVQTFPDSDYTPAVRRIMLSSLFSDRQYAACIEIATPMLATLEPGTLEHDICLHVLGGSYFYTGQYYKAQPLLDQHVKEYEKSLFVIAATYFQAANVSRTQNWAKAGELLDAFIAKYPDTDKNVFLPFALYDRASCHYYEEQYEPALEKLARIIKEFRNSAVVDQAYNLRGNVEQALENPDRAEEAYIKALEIAEKKKNPMIAGEALYNLVALIDAEKNNKEDSSRMKEAVSYSDKFWKEYAEDSPYKVRMAVAQVSALKAVGRYDDALGRLQQVITEKAKSPEARGLEELINTYTEVYLDDNRHTPEELKVHYYDFPGIGFNDRAARALLRVAVIGVFEKVAKNKTNDEAGKRAATAMIQVLFQQLKIDFALKDLTNFILVKLGDYLRKNTSTPREALPYYDEALNRKDQSHRFAALLGRADVYGQSAIPADVDKAIEDFKLVYTDSEESDEREFSLYSIVKLLMAKKDYAKAAEQAKIYLDREKNGLTNKLPHAAEVGLLLANSFEERKMIGDALAMYIKVWSAHMGNIEISAPAMLSSMKLFWDRNKPADRQGAYESGAKYIELTSRFKDKMTDSDLELWQKVEALVKQYEANPSIKSMQELKREKEAASRRR